MAEPPAVVTVTVTAPTEPAGAVIFMVVAAFVSMVAELLPNVTALARARFVPVILTLAPAVVGPAAGEIPVIVGGATYVYEVVAVPPGVVTVTVTAPTEPAGAVVLMVVAAFASMVAELLPNVTEVAPARFVPVMLTFVPAVDGPDTGEMLLIVGAGT